MFNLTSTYYVNGEWERPIETVSPHAAMRQRTSSRTIVLKVVEFTRINDDDDDNADIRNARLLTKMFIDQWTIRTSVDSCVILVACGQHTEWIVSCFYWNIKIWKFTESNKEQIWMVMWETVDLSVHISTKLTKFLVMTTAIVTSMERFKQAEAAKQMETEVHRLCLRQCVLKCGTIRCNTSVQYTNKLKPK